MARRSTLRASDADRERVAFDIGYREIAPLVGRFGLLQPFRIFVTVQLRAKNFRNLLKGVVRNYEKVFGELKPIRLPVSPT